MNFAGNTTLDADHIGMEFPNVHITDLTHNHGGVFLLDDGEQQSVLKMFQSDSRFQHSLYIQQLIERSEYSDITVSMIAFNPHQRWIQFEAGIPINGKMDSAEIRNLLGDIPDWKQQIMHHQEALSSLGIIHNDVHPGNFLLSKTEQRRVLIFDFGNSLMPYDYHLWFNSWHSALAYHRESKVWNRIRNYRSFFDDITEYVRVLRFYDEKLKD